MCLSLVTIAAVLTGVEWSLRLLPVVALGALAVFGGLHLMGNYTQTGQLAYFCVLYLLLEVLRRTVFDPVFLVLFQPLAPQQRLAAHTLAKGTYEPLGMGLTGLLFLAFQFTGLLDGWAPFAWMGGLLLLALLFLRRTYTSYLAELKEGLGQRFAETAELALPDAARQVVLAHLHSPRPTEVLHAVAWLRQRDPAALAGHAPPCSHTPTSGCAWRYWPRLRPNPFGPAPCKPWPCATRLPPCVRQRPSNWPARTPRQRLWSSCSPEPTCQPARAQFVAASPPRPNTRGRKPASKDCSITPLPPPPWRRYRCCPSYLLPPRTNS